MKIKISGIRKEDNRLFENVVDLSRHHSIFVSSDLYKIEIKPFKETTNLSFSQALDYLKQGKKVKRKHWGGYWFIPDDVTLMFEGRDFGFSEDWIVAKLKEGGYAPATPYQGDLLANDWEVVE